MPVRCITPVPPGYREFTRGGAGGGGEGAVSRAMFHRVNQGVSPPEASSRSLPKDERGGAGVLQSQTPSPETQPSPGALSHPGTALIAGPTRPDPARGCTGVRPARDCAAIRVYRIWSTAASECDPYHVQDGGAAVLSGLTAAERGVAGAQGKVPALASVNTICRHIKLWQNDMMRKSG